MFFWIKELSTKSHEQRRNSLLAHSSQSGAEQAFLFSDMFLNLNEDAQSVFDSINEVSHDDSLVTIQTPTGFVLNNGFEFWSQFVRRDFNKS